MINRLGEFVYKAVDTEHSSIRHPTVRSSWLAESHHTTQHETAHGKPLAKEHQRQLYHPVTTAHQAEVTFSHG